MDGPFAAARRRSLRGQCRRAGGTVDRRRMPALGRIAPVTLATSVSVHPLSPTIGAEIPGVDISRPAGARGGGRRPRRPQHPPRHLLPGPVPDRRAAGRLRPPVRHGDRGPPGAARPSTRAAEVLAIDGKVDRASWWHTDVTFLETPAMGSILYMLEAPEVGGDTMWASLQDAYDGLAEPVRAMCDQLIAIHHDPWFAADVAERGGYEWDGDVAREAAAGPPPGRAHAPRERAQRPVRQPAVHPHHLRAVGQREQRHPRDALPPLHQARVHLPLPLARRVRSPSGTTGPRCTTRSTTTATPPATRTG